MRCMYEVYLNSMCSKNLDHPPESVIAESESQAEEKHMQGQRPLECSNFGTSYFRLN